RIQSDFRQQHAKAHKLLGATPFAITRFVEYKCRLVFCKVLIVTESRRAKEPHWNGCGNLCMTMARCSRLGKPTIRPAMAEGEVSDGRRVSAATYTGILVLVGLAAAI